MTPDTTETDLVIANPDGTYTLQADSVPVRAQLQDGTWAPIDVTLGRDGSTGRITPANAAIDVSFSAGGNDPLVVLTGSGDDSDKQVSMSWPDPLPTPTIEANTATYHDVFPGVDLQLAAQGEAFNEVLVVRDSAAAANPALHDLHLKVAGVGVQVSADASDRLVAKDPSSGSIVFGGSPAIAWDSSTHTQVGSLATAQDAGGADVSSLAVSNSPVTTSERNGDIVTETTVAVGVPADTLTGSGVTYPVYIDPSMTGYGDYAVVLSNAATYYDDSTQHPKAGYCGWSGCNGIGTARAYFSIHTAAVAGRATTAHIYSADFNITQIHQGAGCASEPTDLYQSNAFTSSVTYGGPITTELQETSATYSDTCASSQPNRIHFANANVINYVQAGANVDRATTYFALRAPNESDANQWKQFNDDAQLDVTFDFPPSTPSDLSIPGALACPGKPIYTTDTTPTLNARATDNNPSPSSVSLFFQLYTNPTGANPVRYNPTQVSDPSGTTVGWSTNSSNTNSASAMANGNYTYRVYAATGNPAQISGYSSWYSFTLDTVAPSTPTIASFDYPADNWGAPQNAPGIFNVSAAGSTAFAYAFDSSSNLVSPTSVDCNYTSASKRWVTASNGAAAITAPSLSSGPHTLYVKSFDDAHNVSGSSIYSFYVSPTVSGEGATQLEAETLANSSTPLGQLAGQGDPTFVEGASSVWSNGYQEHLIATGGTPAAPQKFTFNFSTSADADYALGVAITSQNHNGIVRFDLDGQALTSNGSPIELDSYSAVSKEVYVPLGGAHLDPGPHMITIDVVGKNPASSDFVFNGTYGSSTNGGTPVSLSNFHDNGFSVGVDFLNVVAINNVSSPCPVGSTQIHQCVAQAMNNNGIAVDNSTGANIGPSSSNSGLSKQALTAAGFGPGAVVTVDSGTSSQATFTMPSYTAGNPDNVIADAQRIPFPAAVSATNIDLLVLSTCGSITSNAATQFTINYVDGAYTNKQLPSIGDWLTPAFANASPGPNTAGRTVAATLPYRDAGTAPVSGQPVVIYHVQVPVDYTDDQVASIVLPRTGTTFTNSCSSPALHVLAVTTS